MHIFGNNYHSNKQVAILSEQPNHQSTLRTYPMFHVMYGFLLLLASD